MRKLKKAFSLALALAMCLGLMAVPAAAVNPGEEWVGDFVVNGDTLVGYYGDGGAITIPSGVKSIGGFRGNTSITSVTIPDGVTSIQLGAFQNCTNLTSVTMPSSITEIGGWAFAGCTNLTGVTIPNGVISISQEAFRDCKSLTSITIPSSVTYLGNSVFHRCTGLKSATVSTTYSENNNMFAECTGLTSVTLPDGMERIGADMFSGCTSLTNVNIPSSVIKIDLYAFRRCESLTSVNIPAGVTGIVGGAFGYCSSLTSIVIPSSIQGIGGSAFEYCTSLTDVYFGGSKAQWKENGGEGAVAHIGPTVHFNSTGPSTTQPTTPPQPQQPAGTTASPTNDKLEVNGTAANPTVYKIGDSNYFKIRDVAALLNGTEKQFAVGYDGAKNAVTATIGQGYAKQPGDLAGAPAGGSQTADPSNDAIYVDGQKITAEVYKINGSNYFKLRDLGKALNFYVGWSAERGMYIETGKPYSE